VGNRVQEKDQSGHITTYVYDALNRLTFTIFPDNTPADLTDNPREQIIYDAAGDVSARIDANGNRTDYGYDAAGRLILVTQPAVLDGASGKMVRPQTRAEYDAAGNQTATTDADGNRTEFVYDADGRLTSTVFADGTSTHVQYDGLGDVMARIDQAGRATTYGYDPLGRLVSVTPPPPDAGAVAPMTSYGYDEDGNLISQTDALNHITRYSYDELNRLVQETLPMGQSESFAYDSVGNEVLRTDFNGSTTKFSYDLMNRLTQTLYPDGSKVTMAYTPTGQRQSVTDGRGTTTYNYDVRDRLIQLTNPDGRSINYTYDAAGNETSLTVPSGTTSYTYDALYRMETVTDPASGLTHYLYDQAGNLVRTELPNGTVETRQYDVLNRLVFLQNLGPGGTVISSYKYTLGPTGLRTRVVEDTGRDVTYTYDNDDRLTSESIVDPVAGTRTIQYTYDAVANRLSQTDSAAGQTKYRYDANDQLLTESMGGKAITYTYDANGNLRTRDGGANDHAAYTWDFENRLVSADQTDSSGTHHVTYRYDVDANRVSESVDGAETRVLVDTNRPLAHVLEEYSPDGADQASYIYGLRLILQNRGGAMSFYHVDGLGSVRALTNPVGAVTDRYIYDAFGNSLARVGTTQNSFQFAGEQFDPSLGFNYQRARYYDLATGRFVSVDPVEGELSDPISRDRYLYANGDPVNNVDPSGKDSLAEVSITAGIVGTLAGLATYSACRIAGCQEGCANLAVAVGATTAASVLIIAVGQALGGALIEEQFAAASRQFIQRATERAAQQALRELARQHLLEEVAGVARAAIVGMAQALRTGGQAALQEWISTIGARVYGKYFLAIVIVQCNQLLQMASTGPISDFLNLVKAFALKEVGQ
jgi:RHS repeat-associated protein